MQLRVCWRLFLILLLPVIVFAQPDDAAKEREARMIALIEQTLTDVAQLKLPENRAHFYSQIGTILWPADKDRGRAVFSKAADDLVAAIQQAETRAGEPIYNKISNVITLRSQVLGHIANHDAEYALELMIRTRPAFITKLLAGPDMSGRSVSDTGDNRIKVSDSQNYVHLAQNERQMEQSFQRLAAEQNPERAVKILKDALAKGITHDTFGMLLRLAEKDKAAAAEIAAQLADRLMDQRFVAGGGQVLYNELQLAQSLLSSHMNSGSGQSGLKLSDAQMRALAAKLITEYLNDRHLAGYVGQSLIGIADRYSPASADLIRKAHPAAFGATQPTSETDAAYQRLMNDESSPEQMIAGAAKLSPNYRREIYQAASRKMMAAGNVTGAREVLDEFFSDDTRDQMLVNFDQQLSYNLINEGKFAEAEAVIDRLPEPQRVPALVNLAGSVFNKDKDKNRPYALSILAKAHALSGERPENTSQMGNVMQVISGYGNIDATQGIRIYESLVSKINELTDAAAVLQGFHSNAGVRNGEFVMMQSDPFGQFGANGYVMAAFAAADFDRTMKLIDGFTRSEVRVSLRLQVAANSGGLTTRIKGHRMLNVVTAWPVNHKNRL